jgi:hypothetical protein
VYGDYCRALLYRYRDTHAAPHDTWLMAQPVTTNTSHLFIDSGVIYGLGTVGNPLLLQLPVACSLTAARANTPCPFPWPFPLPWPVRSQQWVSRTCGGRSISHRGLSGVGLVMGRSVRAWLRTELYRLAGLYSPGNGECVAITTVRSHHRRLLEGE